jgi:hypothetical protein
MFLALCITRELSGMSKRDAAGLPEKSPGNIPALTAVISAEAAPDFFRLDDSEPRQFSRLPETTIIC